MGFFFGGVAVLGFIYLFGIICLGPEEREILKLLQSDVSGAPNY